MPENIRDVTSQYKPPWYEAINPLYTVKKVLQGTFCFPFGSGFGCGEAMEISQGEELSLEANIGAQSSGVSGGVKIGAKFTQTVKWSYTSKKCEYCRPQVCFPNSTLTIAEVTTVAPPFWWTQTIEMFDPGPQGQIERNCTQNDPLCKCSGSETALHEPSPEGTAVTQGPPRSVLMLPTGFGLKEDGGVAQSTTLAQAVGDRVDKLWRTFHDGTSGDVSLGILDPTGEVNWLHPAGQEASNRLSLLSRNAKEYVAGGLPAAIMGRYHTVVAIGPCGAGDEAEVTMTLANLDGDSKTIEAQPGVSHGVATIIAAQFDFGADGLSPGTRAMLHIKLQHKDDPCSASFLTEELIVTQAV